MSTLLLPPLLLPSSFKGLAMSAPPLVPSESSDAGAFGGLAYEPTTGEVLGTVRWEQQGLYIPRTINRPPAAAALLNQSQQVHRAVASVGRIIISSSTNLDLYPPQLLSGWVSGKGNARYFISSSHGFPLVGAIAAKVSFAATWEGGEPEQAGVAEWRVFDVRFVGHQTQAQSTVWKFEDADLAYLPEPLTFGPQFQLGHVVAAGYSVFPSQAKLAEYYHAINDPALKARSFPPDIASAVAILHPNHKIVAPGSVVAAGLVDGIPLVGVQASMYHGMSGGPVIILGGVGVLGVSGQVIGNTITMQVNSNTVLDITSGPARSFLQQYM